MPTHQPRFSALSADTLTAAQRPVAERLMTSLNGPIRGPFTVILRSPGMASGMIELFEYYRFKATLAPRLKELAILILAREWTAHYEWFAHRPAAEKAGLSPDAIAALRLGKRPAALQPDEAVIYDFVVGLIREHSVGDALFATTRDLLGEEQLVDLVSMVGEYMKVALLLGIGGIGVPAGEELPPLGAGR